MALVGAVVTGLTSRSLDEVAVEEVSEGVEGLVLGDVDGSELVLFAATAAGSGDEAMTAAAETPMLATKSAARTPPATAGRTPLFMADMAPPCFDISVT